MEEVTRAVYLHPMRAPLSAKVEEALDLLGRSARTPQAQEQGQSDRPE
jgi:hypothetical protein